MPQGTAIERTFRALSASALGDSVALAQNDWQRGIRAAPRRPQILFPVSMRKVAILTGAAAIPSTKSSCWRAVARYG